MSPALAGRFSTTVPPGKPKVGVFKVSVPRAEMCPVGRKKMMVQKKKDKSWTKVLKKVAGEGIQNPGVGVDL